MKILNKILRKISSKTERRGRGYHCCNYFLFLASLLLPLPLLQRLLLVVPLLLQRRKRRRKSLLKSLMKTWVLFYLTKTCVIGVYFLMVYFKNVLFFGEFLSVILQKIYPPVERIINFDD
ncbi:hypothetical protein ACJW30_06G143600 [Castanea mollissima]